MKQVSSTRGAWVASCSEQSISSQGRIASRSRIALYKRSFHVRNTVTVSALSTSLTFGLPVGGHKPYCISRLKRLRDRMISFELTQTRSKAIRLPTLLVVGATPTDVGRRALWLARFCHHVSVHSGWSNSKKAIPRAFHLSGSGCVIVRGSGSEDPDMSRVGKLPKSSSRGERTGSNSGGRRPLTGSCGDRS